MTVKELIAELQKKPDDADVLVCLDDPASCTAVPLYDVRCVDTNYGNRPVLYLWR
jgi:hypothetical protein